MNIQHLLGLHKRRYLFLLLPAAGVVTNLHDVGCEIQADYASERNGNGHRVMNNDDE
jgi:hypothetical protein